MSMTSPVPSGNDPWGPQLALMSIAEKEALLNRLLIDLSMGPQEVKPTDWPYDLLVARKQEVLDGKVQMQDWEVAKQELLEEIKRR